MIEVENLKKNYEGHWAVRGVSFNIQEGEIFGFIGPNGAGKTTTIRVMATLLEPMAGRVEIEGIDVTIDPEAVRKRIGYMPDHPGVYDRITVREYLEFFADAFRAIHGYGRKEPSWVFRHGGGWRLDHLFASAELPVLAARYHHDWRDAGLSDHSALEADVGAP